MVCIVRGRCRCRVGTRGREEEECVVWVGDESCSLSRHQAKQAHGPPASFSLCVFPKVWVRPMSGCAVGVYGGGRGPAPVAKVTNACTRVSTQQGGEHEATRPGPVHPSSSSVVLMPGAGCEGGLEGGGEVVGGPLLRPWNGERWGLEEGVGHELILPPPPSQGPRPHIGCHDRAQEGLRHEAEMPTKVLEGLGRLGAGWRGGQGGKSIQKRSWRKSWSLRVCVVVLFL